MANVAFTILNTLEAIAKLSAGRKQELADLCFVEKVSKVVNPLRMNVARAKQAVYLIKGDLELRFVKIAKCYCVEMRLRQNILLIVIIT